ncbi:MAG TPA: ADP-ribosylglycohydrolase family protein, partial [Thermomicrobiales bacterium]|nr:ADP-ribosylglycohydrolase family protein [Thermomicrobiales bacterium]
MRETHVTRESRAVGCLVGLGCGDALGGAVEFRSRDDLDRSFPRGVREIMGGGPHRLEPGEVTDDTQMALAIARACTVEGIDLDLVASNFVEWYRSGPKDIGIATRNALALISQGVPWREAGERLQRASQQGVAGNGTVMRCAPLALRFRNDRQRLVLASLDTSRMTHADPRATWGAVALNQAIVHLLDGGDPEGILDVAVSDIEEPAVADAILSVPGMSRGDLRSGGYVLDTLTSSFWCVVNRSGVEEAIVAAVSLGDDADTTGAVTGALAGAAHGVEAIPERWRNRLLVLDELDYLARQLIAWSDPPQ